MTKPGAEPGSVATGLPHRAQKCLVIVARPEVIANDVMGPVIFIR
jgi:hypothetical protein